MRMKCANGTHAASMIDGAAAHFQKDNPMSKLYTIDLTHCADPAEAGSVFAAFTNGQIPVIAEIEPQPDPVYGHTFKWPVQEVKQFTREEDNHA